MITLSDGTVTLTLYHLLWQGRTADKSAGSERVTLGNRLVVQRLAGAAGQEIVLEARREGSGLLGWFLGSQLSQLEAWRDAGTTLTLNYDNDVRPCMIPLGGVNIDPVLLRSNAIDAAARCAGTLTLKEV